HISEMAVHHIEQPDQVVTPGEELWVKIIDIDHERRRISLSIKQAAEGGEVAAEYRDMFGEHAYDEHGNYIGPDPQAEGAQAEGVQAEGAQAEGAPAEDVQAEGTAAGADEVPAGEDAGGPAEASGESPVVTG